IKETDTISVPNYISYSDKPGEAFLLMEWLEGERTSDTDKTLGRNLAKLHQTLGPMHGFETDGYIGILNQPNKLEPNLLTYFSENRLKYHVKYTIDKGMLLWKRIKKYHKFLDQLKT